MAKIKTVYVCSECGFKFPKWLGRCNECGTFGSMEEFIEEKKNATSIKSGGRLLAVPLGEPLDMDDETRVATGIGELDRVLSGGFVQGSLTLVGGEPGVGKSTLLLQICQSLGENHKILYASGEESVRQIKLRAGRLGINTPNLYLLSETHIDVIEDNVAELSPDFLIIDSIQTMYAQNSPGMPGSQSQIRECAHLLMNIAKKKNVSVIVVGHVTKEGSLAGPKLLEHMVDTVMYFEGERQLQYRLIRAVKNRFGAVSEIGMFEMRDAGLVEIKNPSEYLLNGRPQNVSGSVITCTMEGLRPILTEAQALVSFSSFGNPRRQSGGIDLTRVLMIIAALDKRLGLKLAQQDIYINIVGGIKITEPAADLAVAAAIISSLKDTPVDQDTIIFGETGLTGEIRQVSHLEKRVAEAAKLGFKRCIMPGAPGFRRPDNIEIFPIKNLRELFEIL